MIAEDGFDLRAAAAAVSRVQLRRTDVRALREQRKQLFAALHAVHADSSKFESGPVVRDASPRFLSISSCGHLSAVGSPEKLAKELTRQLDALDARIAEEEDKLDSDESICRGLPEWVLSAAQPQLADSPSALASS